MMNTSKLVVFSDLDGTLLDHHTYSFEPALATLKQLAELNIAVIPTTSKTRAEVAQLREDLTLDTPFIVENGAAVYIPIDFLPNQPKDTDIVHGYYRKAFTEPRQHWLDLLSKHNAQFVDCFIGFSQMNDEQISLATGLSTQDAHLANQREFSEPLKWLAGESKKAAFSQQLKAAGANVLQGGRFVHISGKCNKGIALQWLRKEMSEQLKQNYKSVALGDSYNDNDMLETADIAVQIKTDKHSFPKLFRTDSVIQSTLLGPKGWSECLQQILTDFKLIKMEC